MKSNILFIFLKLKNEKKKTKIISYLKLYIITTRWAQQNYTRTCPEPILVF